MITVSSNFATNLIIEHLERPAKKIQATTDAIGATADARADAGSKTPRRFSRG